MTRWGTMTLLVIVMLFALLPADRIGAAGMPTAPLINVNQCVLTVEFDADSRGVYSVNIWDAGVVVQSASSGWTLPGMTLVFGFLITDYAEASAPGVGVEIVRSKKTLFQAQITEIEPICSASRAGGCSFDISGSAVVGLITDNTFTYWAPSVDTRTDTVLQVGTTWWVLGPDSSGAFYKVLVACAPVWVPAGALGPNFDQLWNGRPLPSDIVR